MKKNPKTDRPGHRRRLGHRHQRAHQRHHRRLRVVAAMKDGEKKQLADKAGAPPIEIPVAKDGLSVYVHESNPLTRDLDGRPQGDLHGQGDVLEGAGRAGREDHSVLAREQLGHVRVLQGARARERRLHAPRAEHAGHRRGRERGQQGEVRHRLRRRRVLEGDQGPQDQEGQRPARVAPTEATIKDGSYPLSRPLFFYVRAKPSAEIKAFTDWVLSPEGQSVVAKVGYFPSANSPEISESCRQCCLAGTGLKARGHGSLLPLMAHDRTTGPDSPTSPICTSVAARRTTPTAAALCAPRSWSRRSTTSSRPATSRTAVSARAGALYETTFAPLLADGRLIVRPRQPRLPGRRRLRRDHVRGRACRPRVPRAVCRARQLDGAAQSFLVEWSWESRRRRSGRHRCRAGRGTGRPPGRHRATPSRAPDA